MERDAGPPGGARARPDQRLAALHAAADARAGADAHEPGGLEEPEQVAPEDPLRRRRLPRPDREAQLARAGELVGDLEARVAAADDEPAPGREVARLAVGGAAELDDAPDPGAPRSPARAGPGTARSRPRPAVVERTAGQLDPVAARGGAQPGPAAVELDGELEAPA
ncbi:MAG TPA: hypothetical protein VN213_11935 [Solirubrobacteraceae bacterium]|nr:hypothetical protein [Solirubrobacteraceae bacterium]